MFVMLNLGRYSGDLKMNGRVLLRRWGGGSWAPNSSGSEQGQIIGCFGNVGANLASKVGWTSWFAYGHLKKYIYIHIYIYIGPAFLTVFMAQIY